MSSGEAPSTLAAIRVPEEGLENLEEPYVDIVDQLSLPGTVHWDRITNATQAFEAIKSMRVRGSGTDRLGLIRRRFEGRLLSLLWQH